MSTISHNGGTGHRAIARQPYILEEIIDFAEVSGNVTIGTTDTVQVLKVPSNSFVSSCGYQILTAESVNTSAQVALGDGASTGRWVAATTISATAFSAPSATTSALGFTHISSDTIDLLLSVDDPTNAVLRVWAVVQDLTPLATADYKTYTSAA